mgnify:CR=1 FL=1
MFDPHTDKQTESVVPSGGEKIAPVVPAATGIVAPNEIHAMPSKFLVGTKAASGNRHILLIASIAGGVCVLAFGGYLLYRNVRVVPATNTPDVNTTVVANANTNSDTNQSNLNTANTNAGNINSANTNAAAPTVLKQTVTDPDTDVILNTATLTLPYGAVPDPDMVITMISLSSSVGAYATSKTLTPSGGVFLLMPAKTKLAKKATLQITYTDSSLLALGAAGQESSLTLAYWSTTDWKPINSILDEKTNTVTADITEFYNDGIALVVPKARTTTNANTNTAPLVAQVVPSHDTDNDGLTDQEELLYGTVASDPDTDDDTFRDGQEVIARYNPNGKNKLTDSGLVKTYQNATYRYSILYPPSWTAGPLNADKLVLLTSITGEFIQISVQANTGGLSAREWYQSLNPSVSASSLKDVTVGNLLGIIGPDGLNVYLADKANIYQITYNIGIKTEANYLSTFTMMYTSFLANITMTQPINVSTNTNSSANTNSANTNAMNTNSTNTNTANTNTANTNNNRNSNTNSL